MKKFNTILLKCSSLVASLALVIGASSVSSACYWWFNQPKMPENMSKYIKTK